MFKNLEKIENSKNKGFTLLELIISIGIFALMTALLMAKYSSFNQGVILTNLAYDVALTIRNAQFHGLNVKSASRDANEFNKEQGGGAYGVHFEAGDTGDKTTITFFADNKENNNNGIYDESGDKFLTAYEIKRGSRVNELCVYSTGNPNCTSVDSLDITFVRPDPNAIIKANGNINNTYDRAIISIISSGAARRRIEVLFTGQISVLSEIVS